MAELAYCSITLRGSSQKTCVYNLLINYWFRNKCCVIVYFDELVNGHWKLFIK